MDVDRGYARGCIRVTPRAGGGGIRGEDDHAAALLTGARLRHDGISSDETGTLAATAIRAAISGPGSRAADSHARTVVLDTPTALARSCRLMCAHSRAWRIAAARAWDGS